MCNLDHDYQTARAALLRKALDPSVEPFVRTGALVEVLNLGRKRGDHAESCADCQKSMKIHRFTVERTAREALQRMDG